MVFKMRCLVLFHFTLLMGSVVLEPFEVPCEREDSECLKNNFQELADLIVPGIPELGIGPTDPVVVEYIEGQLPKQSFKFYDSTVTGLMTCTFESISILNKQASKIRMVYDCPGVSLVGQFKIKASLFSITSHGNYGMDIGKYLITVDAALGRVASNGTDHLQLKKFNLVCNMLGGLQLVLKSTDTSSFLVNMANDYLRKNYKTVAVYTQDSVWSAIIKKHFQRLNKYLMTKPVEKILILDNDS